ncbi:MAG TPA: hypothetical protein VEH01_02625 [Nitrososphaerales archaeon]|nr:hypothetical protein [Nitrososphaerales archaeon]
MMESSDSTFGGAMRRRLIEDFVVSYYNGALNLNMAEKDPSTGREVEFLMDAPQFDKIRKPDVWSFSNAVGTGYQYRVVYRDRRFSDLGRLIGIYSGTVEAGAEAKASAEQDLYQSILVMIKEGRVPKTFKIRSAQEVQEQKVISIVEELSRSVEELGKKVKALEEKLATREAPPVLNDQGATPATPVPQNQTQ